MNSIGGDIMMRQTSIATVCVIRKPLIDIRYNVSSTTISVARRVKSFPFVTDVRCLSG
jgi:hypothetical protein